MSEVPAFRSRYGPCALVAGAAVGLGAEWARQIADHGLGLVLLDRGGWGIERTSGEIRAARDVRVRSIALDLARADLVDAIGEAVADLEIGLLVCNAACSVVAPFLELETAQLHAMLDVNCRAPLLLAHALSPARVGRGPGGV